MLDSKVKYFQYCPQAFALTEFFDREECKRLVERGESLGFEIAPINQGADSVVSEQYRNNSRVVFDDTDLARDIWDRASPYLPPVIDGWSAYAMNERFRLYRYEQYQMFRRHSDGRFARTETEESRLTFMVYLNEGFEGGHTAFDEFNVYPVQGMALCFHHALSHEGAAVTRGRKYALRTDVMYRYAI